MKEKMEDKTTEDKWKKLEEILYGPETGLESKDMGVGKDPYTHVQESLHVIMKKNPKIIKEIEELGFKVIYPAQISEDDQKRLEENDSADKYTYDLRSDTALIVDTSLPHHSMSLADRIEQHYFSLGKDYASDYDVHSMGGIGKNEYIEPMSDGFRARHAPEYDGILKSVGFKTEQITNENGQIYLKVHTDGQMFPVKQSKLSQIYTNAKDKIKGIFNKIKTLATKSRTEKQVKNDLEEQVKDDPNER